MSCTVSTKRSLEPEVDSFGNEINGQRMQGKRCRLAAAASPAGANCGGNGSNGGGSSAMALSGSSPLRSGGVRPIESVFTPSSPSEPLEHYLPYAKRRRLWNTFNTEDVDQVLDAALRKSGTNQGGVDASQRSGQLFTLEQMRAIVAKALDDREAVLREEYDATLQEKLNEQFSNFSRFNQDYVSRHLRQSEYNYMS